jgi:predicted nucleotidyltransferase
MKIAVTAEQIEAIRAWARSKPRVEQVRLFGSRCKGTHREDSDIDIAVTVSEDRHYTRATIWMFDKPKWSAELSQALDAAADVRITDIGKPCKIRGYCAEVGDILIYDASEAPKYD